MLPFSRDADGDSRVEAAIEVRGAELARTIASRMAQADRGAVAFAKARPRAGKREISMIRFELLKDAGVLIVEPTAPIAADDFREISRAVDPYLGENGKLNGLLVEAKSFPGWESFGALLEHIRFVHDHHRRIDRVAAVTDSAFLKIAPKIAEHFAHPEIKVFASGERTKALAWLQTGA